MDGITISTGQLIAVIVFGAGSITALLKVIQSQYEKQNMRTEDAWESRFKEMIGLWEKRHSDQQAAHELRVKEILESQARSTDRYENRIKWLEERDAGWRAQQATYIATLEKAVEVQQQQQDNQLILINALSQQANPVRAIDSKRRPASQSGSQP